LVPADLARNAHWQEGRVATLVTGLGYIGSALVERLLAEGEHVVGVENFFSTPREQLTPMLATGGLRLVEGSICDPATWERAFGGEPIETVFHLAAQASARPDAAPIAYTQETNFTGPRMLLGACSAHDVQRTIFASSMRLYRTPLPKTVSEAAPIDPTDLVHLSQLYGEVLLAEYRRRDSLAPGGDSPSRVAVRLGIVHGLSPVMKADARFLAAPQLFCLQAVRGERLAVATGPRTALAFVHVQDAVSALLQCRNLPPEVEIMNVASEIRTVASVARAVQRAAAERGIAASIAYQGRDVRVADRTVSSRLTATGFRPELRIENSVGAVLDHYLTRAGGSCASS
jgi:UDP-glucose 4-epimerase